MEYTLVWDSQIRTMALPIDAKGWSEAERWTWVQMRITGLQESEAFTKVMRMRYPGLGYDGISLTPVPFCCENEGDDRSYPSVSSNKHSHTPPPVASEPAAKDGASGNGGRRRHAPQRPTSTASRPHAHHPSVVFQSGMFQTGMFQTTGFQQAALQPANYLKHNHYQIQKPNQRQQRSTHHATPRMGGWMGSAPTNT
jgi:hypothetical protein